MDAILFFCGYTTNEKDSKFEKATYLHNGQKLIFTNESFRGLDPNTAGFYSSLTYITRPGKLTNGSRVFFQTLRHASHLLDLGSHGFIEYAFVETKKYLEEEMGGDLSQVEASLGYMEELMKNNNIKVLVPCIEMEQLGLEETQLAEFCVF